MTLSGDLIRGPATTSKRAPWQVVGGRAKPGHDTFKKARQ